MNGVSVADDLDVDLAADEAQRGVGQQRARQQARLAQDLEAVADPQHRAALARELDDRPHDRREAGDRPDAQVVAVGEAARDDDRVDALQVGVGVPEELGVADALGGLQRVDVVAGPREPDDADLHVRDLVVLDERVGQQPAAHLVELRGSSTSSSTSRPTCTLRTPSKPERGQRALDGDPLRVEDPGLGRMRTRALTPPSARSQASNGSPVIVS